MVFIFANGKGVRVPVNSYQTKGTRRKLTGAYSTASEIRGVFLEKEPLDILMVSENNRGIVISSSLVPLKTTRSSQGVAVMNLKKGVEIKLATADVESYGPSKKYRKTKIPATGATLDGLQEKLF